MNVVNPVKEGLQEAVIVNNLTIKFGDFIAVNNISFTVKKGEIFGFLGANGAGKTTTIRMLCGLLEPSQGHAQIAGFDYASGVANIKAKVGYMSQRFTLYNDLTVEENLWFSSALRKLDRDYTKKRIHELCSFIGFEQSLKTLVQDLPGGLKQELSLVCALLHDPEIIFLDEPTAGVSPSSRVRFWELIRRLSSSGKTVFVTTHFMDEAEECHRIALMRAGEIISLGSPAQLKLEAFPDILLELAPHQNFSPSWIEACRIFPGVRSIVPYGRQFHVIVENDEKRLLLEQKFSHVGHFRVIQPSLEDVFIRLVEGVNR